MNIGLWLLRNPLWAALAAAAVALGVLGWQYRSLKADKAQLEQRLSALEAVDAMHRGLLEQLKREGEAQRQALETAQRQNRLVRQKTEQAVARALTEPIPEEQTPEQWALEQLKGSNANAR